MDTALCINTLEKSAKAIDTREAILHSDGGSTYMSYDYQNKGKRPINSTSIQD